MLAVGVIITGAMHEDGLADCADGFWGGWDRARRLEIMKDSSVGVYGVIALGLGLLLRWQALILLLDAGGYWAALAAVAATSRASMVVLMNRLPNPRAGGLSHSVGRPSTQATWLAIGIAAVICLFVGHLGIVIWVAAGCTLCAALSHRKIGGQTGDVLGATQQITEIIALCVIAVGLT